MMVLSSNQEDPAAEGELVATLVSMKQPKQQLQHSFQRLVLAVLAAAAVAAEVEAEAEIPQTSSD